MDQETIRLLITASAAIVGALGGAGITALINHKNTVKQLAASKAQHDQQWLETRAVERERWVRDKKTESYSQFIRVASPLASLTLSHIRELASAAKGEAGELDLHTTLNDVVIFGSREVIVAASQYRQLVKEIGKAASEIQQQAADEATANGNLNASELEQQIRTLTIERSTVLAESQLPVLIEKFSTLVDLMRKDCGMDSLGGISNVNITVPRT